MWGGQHGEIIYRYCDKFVSVKHKISTIIHLRAKQIKVLIVRNVRLFPTADSISDIINLTFHKYSLCTQSSQPNAQIYERDTFDTLVWAHVMLSVLTHMPFNVIIHIVSAPPLSTFPHNSRSFFLSCVICCANPPCIKKTTTRKTIRMMASDWPQYLFRVFLYRTTFVDFEETYKMLYLQAIRNIIGRNTHFYSFIF